MLDSIVRDVVKIATEEDLNLSKFGICLRYKYTITALAAGNLKGCDKLLFDSLTSRGIVCHLLTVLVHEIEMRLEEDEENRYEYQEEHAVFSFSQDDIAYVNKQGPKPEHASWKEMRFVRDWSKEKIVIEQEDRARHYCGNYTVPSLVKRSGCICSLP